MIAMLKMMWDLTEAVLSNPRTLKSIDKAVRETANKIPADVYEGVRDGSRETFANLKGCVTIGKADLDERRCTLLKQSVEYKKQCDAADASQSAWFLDRESLLATTFVGGDSLATYVAEGRVPDEVARAYALQYPDLAAHRSLIEELHRLRPDQIVGLGSGIKGKLFELRYLDYLNDGHLPDGYHAFLADTANQPGWDIGVLGPDDHVANIIQLKATESVGYVRHALDTYPHIDVVTTSEVYSHLSMLGAAQHVTDSGVANSALNAAVSSGFDDGYAHAHLGPPILALAIAAWSSYRRDDLDRYEKCKLAGNSGTKSWLAYLAGGSVAVATQTWWLAIVGSMATRLILDKGKSNVSELSRLDDQIATNQRVLASLGASA